MVGVPLKQLLNLKEVVLFSQLDGLVPLIQENTTVDGSFHVSHFEISSGRCVAKTHRLESFTQWIQNGTVFRQDHNQLFKIVEIFKLEISFDETLVVLGRLIVFDCLVPFTPLGGVVSEILVSFLELLVISCALFDQLNDSWPVSEFSSHIQCEVFSVDCSINIFSFVVSAEPGTNFSFLFVPFVKCLKFLDELYTVIVICFDKGSFGHVEVQLIKGILSDEFPKSWMWVLFNKLNSLSKTNLSEEVSCVLKGFGLVMGDHFVDVFYVLWILQDFIEHDGFDLQVGEVAQVSRSKDWLLLNIVIKDEKSVFLHQSTQLWIIS